MKMEPYIYMNNIRQVARTLKRCVDEAANKHDAKILDAAIIKIANDLDYQDTCFDFKLFLDDCGIPTR